jgi:hypothetical protein
MFCAISDIEQFLQIAVPALKLAAANRAITEATAAIQNYTHQVLEAVVADTITLDCTGGRRLFLPELPVTSLGSVTEDGDLLVVDDDYKLGEHGILHRIGDYWTVGIQIIEVVYSHGYTVIPDDIVSIATRAASRAYQAGLRAEEMSAVPGITALSLGDYSVSFGGEGAGEGVLGASAAPLLLKSEKERLDKYRQTI